MAQNVLARTFELRCRNSPDFHLCCIFLRLGGKREAGVPGCGVRGPGVRGPGLWKTLGVENTGCGKHGIWWKTRGLVETRGLGGKHGV